MTENELRKFLKEQDAVYKKVKDVLRARGVDVISIDYIEQCETSNVKVSFAYHWGTVAEHDCIVIPVSDFVEPEKQGETTMAAEEKKVTLLDYTDPGKFWKDYIRDNQSIVLDLSGTQYNFLRVNKDTIMLYAQAIYRSAHMTEWKCVEVACNAVLKLAPENESLDSIFNQWLVEYSSKFDPSNEHNGLRLLPSYMALDDDDKAAFGKWLMERYSSKSPNTSEEKAIAILEQFNWCSDRELIPIDSRMRELIDRVRVYIDRNITPENAVYCVLRDWAKGVVFGNGLDQTLKRLVYKTIMELKLKEKQHEKGTRRMDK